MDARERGPDSPQIRILVVDDHAAIRHLVRSMLEKQPNFVVYDEAGDGAEAVRIARETHPDVVVMDAEMPVLNGFTAARRIRSEWPDTSIVMLSTHTGAAFTNFANEGGFQGYVTKSEALDSLVTAVQHAAASKDFFQS
jgi:DNA-binding NarL/FixJ family response regulator